MPSYLIQLLGLMPVAAVAAVPRSARYDCRGPRVNSGRRTRWNSSLVLKCWTCCILIPSKPHFATVVSTRA